MLRAVTQAASTASQTCGVLAPEEQSRDIKLLFLDLVNEFYARKCDCRGIEALKAQHRSNPLFHSPMFLFDKVV